MTSTTSGTKGMGGGGAGAKPAKQPITKKQIQMLIGVAAVIALGVAAWFGIKSMKTTLPRLDEPTPALAKYVMTDHFRSQPFDMQKQFMQALDERNEKEDPKQNKPGKELDKAFAEGKINETEYRTALQMAWFGKRLARVDKWASLSGVQRQAYLDEIIVKKLNEDEAEERNPKPKVEGKISGNPTGTEERAHMSKWPPEARERWEAFEKAYKNREDEIEKLRAQTRPAARK